MALRPTESKAALTSTLAIHSSRQNALLVWIMLFKVNLLQWGNIFQFSPNRTHFINVYILWLGYSLFTYYTDFHFGCPFILPYLSHIVYALISCRRPKIKFYKNHSIGELFLNLLDHHSLWLFFTLSVDLPQNFLGCPFVNKLKNIHKPKKVHLNKS